MKKPTNNSSNNNQGNNKPQPIKPPYKPNPIRMTIVENGLSTDKIGTKTKEKPKQ